MARSRPIHFLFAVLTVLAVVIGPVRTANAVDNGCAPGAWCFPAGSACPNFGIQIQFGSSEHNICQEFRDANDRTVHVFGASTGDILTLTNMSTGATLALPPADSNLRVELNPDDSCTTVARGAYAVIRSPVHRGSPPEALLYNAQVIYTVSPGWIFAIRRVSGEPTDICAALEGA